MEDEEDGRRGLPDTGMRDGQSAGPGGRHPTAGQEMKGARMNGAGSREGSPPWDPAEPGGRAAGTAADGSQPSPARDDATPQPSADGAETADTQPGQPEAGTQGATGREDGAQATGGAAQPRKPGARRKRRKRSFWRELPVLVVVALFLALIIKTYAIQAFYIPSGSMQNTLDIGDRVLINKLVYDFRSIHRGDIVVFDGDGSWDLNTQLPTTNPFKKFVDNLASMVGLGHGGDDYVKRVIGIPGDHVACCDAQGRVTVNGVPLNEQSYLYPGNTPSETRFSIIVPPGRLWVMGDHRLVSYDSRGHMGDPGGGTIPESAVLGRAFVIIWPPSRWRFLPIPATFQQPKLNAAPATASQNAALATALDSGTIPVRPDGSALPLAFGFAGAVPLTWLQRRARRRLRGRLSARRARRR
jgi:signal peptidase I